MWKKYVLPTKISQICGKNTFSLQKISQIGGKNTFFSPKKISQICGKNTSFPKTETDF